MGVFGGVVIDPEGLLCEGLVSPLASPGPCFDSFCGVLLNTSSPLADISFSGDMGGVGLEL